MLRVGLTGSHRSPNISATKKARTCSSSSTTSSALPRPVPKYPRCLAACLPPWATSPTLATEMGAIAGTHHFHQEGLHHVGAGHLCARRRPTPIPPPQPPSLTSTPPRTCRVDIAAARHLPRRRSARLPHRVFSIPASSAPTTTTPSQTSVKQYTASATRIAAGHHRHSRHGRAFGRRQAYGRACA